MDAQIAPMHTDKDNDKGGLVFDCQRDWHFWADKIPLFSNRTLSVQSDCLF
jgi:hypothetical protein